MADRFIRFLTAVVTAVIALTAFGGVGTIGGGLTFGPAIDARLPFRSLVLAGLALLVFVAAPMTLAAVAGSSGPPISFWRCRAKGPP